MQLKGKIALVTGASRGIGRAIITKFVESGAHVIYTYIDSLDLEQERILKELSKNANVQVKSYCSDASNFTAVIVLIKDIVQEFGRLDILVNNAGITRDNLLLRMTEQDWDDVIHVNLKSVFNTVKEAIKIFIKQRSGVIINIASVVGIRGNSGQSNYAASKAGIIGLTKSIALELGSRNIRSNAIAPGFIQTAMTANLLDEVKQGWINSIPLKRIGQPEDVANCALFLASDAARYITGQVIQVDGGMLT